MNTFKAIAYKYFLPVLGRCFRRRNRYCNVIYYHDVVQGEGDSYMHINAEEFRRQMLYLKAEGYETLTFSDLEEHPDKQTAGPKRVLITFDDGWLSNYQEIFEWMKRHGIKYNIFLTVGKIGSDAAYLNWEQVRQMQESGVVGFGVHTMTHPDLSQFDGIDTRMEFDEADRLFRQETGRPALDFCYPFGKYGQASNDYLSYCPYHRIYTSDLDYSRQRAGQIFFGRAAISADDSMDIFSNKVKGYYNIYQSLKGR